MNSFTFNGKSSSDFGLLISKKDIYSAPARDVSFISVPGRNGDVIVDNNRYNNIDISYTVSFLKAKERAKQIKVWLCQPGYLRLTDTYQPQYYRLASFASKLPIDELLENVGNAQLIFNCKPFMYAVSGDTTQVFTKTAYISNPEAYDSLPYIKITGSGNVTLNIGSVGYSITNISSYIELDCELMSAYKGTTLCNNKINFTEFPTIPPGTSRISWTGTVTKVEIIPRWRTL